MKRFDNWEPTAEDIQWCANLLRMLNQGATWAVPATGTIYEVDHKNCKLVRICTSGTVDADRLHARNKIVFKKLGYTVTER